VWSVCRNYSTWVTITCGAPKCRVFTECLVDCDNERKICIYVCLFYLSRSHMLWFILRPCQRDKGSTPTNGPSFTAPGLPWWSPIRVLTEINLPELPWTCYTEPTWWNKTETKQFDFGFISAARTCEMKLKQNAETTLKLWWRIELIEVKALGWNSTGDYWNWASRLRKEE